MVLTHTWRRFFFSLASQKTGVGVGYCGSEKEGLGIERLHVKGSLMLTDWSCRASASLGRWCGVQTSPAEGGARNNEDCQQPGCLLSKAFDVLSMTANGAVGISKVAVARACGGPLVLSYRSFPGGWSPCVCPFCWQHGRLVVRVGVDCSRLRNQDRAWLAGWWLLPESSRKSRRQFPDRKLRLAQSKRPAYLGMVRFDERERCWCARVCACLCACSAGKVGRQVWDHIACQQRQFGDLSRALVSHAAPERVCLQCSNGQMQTGCNRPELHHGSIMTLLFEFNARLSQATCDAVRLSSVDVDGCSLLRKALLSKQDPFLGLPCGLLCPGSRFWITPVSGWQLMWCCPSCFPAGDVLPTPRTKQKGGGAV